MDLNRRHHIGSEYTGQVNLRLVVGKMKSETSGQHTDDRSVLSLDAYRFGDNGWIGVELISPKRVGDDRHRGSSVDIIGLSKTAVHCRCCCQDVEYTCGHSDPADADGPSARIDGEIAVRVGSDVVECSRLCMK